MAKKTTTPDVTDEAQNPDVDPNAPTAPMETFEPLPEYSRFQEFEATNGNSCWKCGAKFDDKETVYAQNVDRFRAGGAICFPCYVGADRG